MSRSAVPARHRLGLVLCLCLALPPMRISAQTAYDKGEFAARRERLLAGMPDGIAVILGGQAHEYPVRFRQSPDLYYLTGLEEPGLVLVLNGVTKNAAVFALKRPKFGAAGSHARSARRTAAGRDLRPAGAADGELLHLPHLRRLESGGAEALRAAHPARRPAPLARRGPGRQRHRDGSPGARPRAARRRRPSTGSTRPCRISRWRT